MPDSTTTEDGDGHHTTVIKTRSGGNAGLMITLFVIVALVAAIAYFLFAQAQNDNARTDAVVGAARSVGDAAQDGGKAISDAADRAAPK